MREGTTTLADGRTIGHAEYGPDDGTPVLHFHGLPGGRYYDLDPTALADADVRLITLERPGIGLSSRKPDRVLTDWPADVAEVADALGLERFAVLGTSMGGPNATVTGWALPDRVTRVGLRCAMGPAFDHPEFDEELQPAVGALMPFARQDQDGAREVARMVLGAERDRWLADREAYFDTWLETWPENDRPAFLANKDRWMDILEASYATEHGYADDVIAGYGPWGFDPAEVRVPVRAWHGTADGAAPLGLVEALVKQTGGDLVTYEGEGHYLPPTCDPDILGWLAAG